VPMEQYAWIPASAGMTEEVPSCTSCRESQGICVLQASAPYPEGVRRGKAPLPRVWGCPPIPESPPKNGGQGVERKSRDRLYRKAFLDALSLAA